VFEAFGDHAEGKGLNPSNGLVTSPAVAEDAGQIGNLADPATVVLAFEFNR
jgi:hypothetical protein